MMKNIYSLLLLCWGVSGCSSPRSEDFVGVWIGDSVKLELKSDGSCIATGNNAYLLLGEGAKKDSVNYILRGKWEFGGLFKHLPKKWYERNVLRIDLIGKDTGRTIGNILHYQKSLTNKSYTLYFDLSDPDEMDRFELRYLDAWRNTVGKKINESFETGTAQQHKR